MKYDYQELPRALVNRTIRLGTKLRCRECRAGDIYSVGEIYIVQDSIHGYVIRPENKRGKHNGLNGWDGKWEIYCDLPKTPLKDYL